MHVYLYMLVYYACVCLLIAVQCLLLIYTFRVPRIEVETDMVGSRSTHTRCCVALESSLYMAGGTQASGSVFFSWFW